MARKRYSAEQIIVKLREAEVLESKGKNPLRNRQEYWNSRTDVDPLA